MVSDGEFRDQAGEGVGEGRGFCSTHMHGLFFGPQASKAGEEKVVSHGWLLPGCGPAHCKGPPPFFRFRCHQRRRGKAG